MARRPERAIKLPKAEVYKASYDKTPETVEALTGVSVLFMVSAAEHPNRLQQHYDFIDAAEKAGVTHIVYTSFYKAASDSTFTLARDHAATESYIKSKGLTYTFLRDNFYLDFFVELCQTYGEIKGPAGLGRVSAVLRSDIAAVAATILQNPEKWENQTLDLTGPEDLSMSDIVQQVGEHLGKELSYLEETVDEAYQSRKEWPAQNWEYDAWVTTYTAIAVGEQSGVSDAISRVLKRPATSLAEYLEKQFEEGDYLKDDT